MMLIPLIYGVVSTNIFGGILGALFCEVSIIILWLGSGYCRLEKRLKLQYAFTKSALKRESEIQHDYNKLDARNIHLIRRCENLNAQLNGQPLPHNSTTSEDVRKLTGEV